MIKVKDLIGEQGIDYEIHQSPNAPEKPAVSILMPTYCRGDNGLLKRAIRSVIDQTFSDFELIIIDDGSVDWTRMIIEQAMQEDPRIVYIRNHENSGMPSVKVMQGFRFAKADYITYQFDDDQWYPDALETMYQTVKKEPVNTFAYGACDYIKILEDKKLILGDKKIDKNDIFRVNTIPNNTVIHHRELFTRYGSYDPHLFLRRLTDWDLWKRWLDSGAKVKHIDKVLSIVEEQRVGSLYTTYDSDIALTRIIGSRPWQERNEPLTPKHYEEYEIDDLSFIEDQEMRNLLYAKKIKPYYDAHPTLVQKIKHRQFLFEEDKKTILITKKNYRIEKDLQVTDLLQKENPYFRTFYMQSEHLPLDPSALDYADATLLVGEPIDFSYETVQTLRQKPHLFLKEKQIPMPKELLRLLRQQAQTLETNAQSSDKDISTDSRSTSIASPSDKKEDSVSSETADARREQTKWSTEEIDLLTEKNLRIEEQQTAIRKLRRQIDELTGCADSSSGHSGSTRIDVSELCDRYDRLRFDKRTKLIRHLTRADYEGNRLYRDIITAFAQQDYISKGYYAGWSGFLAEGAEELVYPLRLPEEMSILRLYTTNYNTQTETVVATLQIISDTGDLIADIPLRGIDLKHQAITDIAMPDIQSEEAKKASLIRLKPLPISRSCGISLLEWKIRAFTGKIKDKQLCLGFR